MLQFGHNCFLLLFETKCRTKFKVIAIYNFKIKPHSVKLYPQRIMLFCIHIVI
jgi:hypothetical protein